MSDKKAQHPDERVRAELASRGRGGGGRRGLEGAVQGGGWGVYSISYMAVGGGSTHLLLPLDI